MFGTIRKHQTWLWFIIIGVMILSMATFTQMNRSDNKRGGPGNFGEIDGKPITDAEYRNAWNETSLAYLMRYREFPDPAAEKRNGFNQEQETLHRIFLIRKLQQYNIQTDSDSAAQFANLFLREFGRGENVPMDKFESLILQRQGLTTEDFQRFVEHDVAIQQLVSVIGASGTLIPPEEIEALYTQAHQDVKAQVVVFSASNYLATIPEPTSAFLGQYYTNEEPKYREPDRLQVSYVHFNITNYLADAKKELGTNLPIQVEDAYRRLGTNALSLGKTEADEKAKIGDILIRQTALSTASNSAFSFQRDLNNSKETPHLDDLKAMAKEKGLEVRTTKPFDKEYGPSDIELPPDSIAGLFDLTAEDPFPTKPVTAEDGAYILAFNKFIPSRVPPLDEIRSRVVADSKEFQATRTAQMSAQIFEQTATNGLAQGKTFAAVAAGARVKPFDLPPFSLSTESLPEIEEDVDLNAFKQKVVETPTGKLSPLIPTHSGAMIVYVAERLPVDKAKMQADMPTFSKMVRQARESQAFNLWFQKEFSAALPNLPTYRQQGRS